MSERKQARRYSLNHRHSGWKKELVKNQLKEATELVDQWKTDLNVLDVHVKKVEVEKTSTKKAQDEMAAKRETARKFLEDTEVEFAGLGKKMEDLTHEEEEDLDDRKKKATSELDKGETKKKKKLETELAGINETFQKKTAKAKLDKAVAKTEAERGW